MSRVIKNIIKINRLNSSEKVFLTILHPELKPPHIAYTLNGICYSLSVKGKKAVNIDSLINKFLLKNKKILFLELDIKNDKDLFEEILRSYKKANYDNTCLSPIKNYLELTLNDAYTQLPFVFNVVEKLQKNNIIKNTYGVNIEGDFKLTEYSKEEVESCISSNIKNQ